MKSHPLHFMSFYTLQFVAVLLDFESTGRFSTFFAHYIEENAQVCVKTEGWLELPKPALIQLLKSDEVSVL